MVESDNDIRCQVRTTNNGIFLEIGGVIFAPSYEQAIAMADSIDNDPASYGLGELPDVAKKLTAALRTAAEVWRNYTMGVFKPGAAGQA